MRRRDGYEKAQTTSWLRARVPRINLIIRVAFLKLACHPKVCCVRMTVCVDVHGPRGMTPLTTLAIPWVVLASWWGWQLTVFWVKYLDNCWMDYNYIWCISHSGWILIALVIFWHFIKQHHQVRMLVCHCAVTQYQYHGNNELHLLCVSAQGCHGLLPPLCKAEIYVLCVSAQLTCCPVSLDSSVTFLNS